MRLAEISPPTTHPHLAEITIDPADWHRLRSMIDDARELRLIRLADDQPDRWLVVLGCASERVREMMVDAWG